MILDERVLRLYPLISIRDLSVPLLSLSVCPCDVIRYHITSRVLNTVETVLLDEILLMSCMYVFVFMCVCAVP